MKVANIKFVLICIVIFCSCRTERKLDLTGKWESSNKENPVIIINKDHFIVKVNEKVAGLTGIADCYSYQIEGDVIQLEFLFTMNLNTQKKLPHRRTPKFLKMKYKFNTNTLTIQDSSEELKYVRAKN